MMDFIITYLIYILALVAVVFLFLFFHAKLEVLRLRRKVLSEILVKSGLDLEKFNLKDLFNL